MVSLQAIKKYINLLSPPRILTIETVLGCNLSCPECAIGSKTITRKNRMMTFEEYKIIFDKVSWFSKYVYLHSWGEPMLNDDIIKILEYTASKKVKSDISTNANNMTDELARRLILSGVNDIIVSIDGTDQETYEIYRVGGDFEKALKGLRLLSKYNRKFGRNVNITPQFVVFKHNEHQIESFKKLCKRLLLTPYFKDPYLRDGTTLRASGFFKGKKKEQFRHHSKREQKEFIVNCPDFRNSLLVLVDGQVSLCCYDHNGTMTFGNLLQSSFFSIYYGHKFLNFRKNAFFGKIPKFCRENCLARF